MPILINAVAITPMSMQAYVSASAECGSIVRSRCKSLRLSEYGLLRPSLMRPSHGLRGTYSGAGTTAVNGATAYTTSTDSQISGGFLGVDQAWGLFQGSIAAHNNHAAYYSASELT